jgi:ketosteroid isomerase-like protein
MTLCRHCNTRDTKHTSKDYQESLDQFQGGIEIEYRGLKIVAGDNVAFSRGQERMNGTLKGGEKFDTWVRFTECYRKHDGHWLAIHDHISVPVELATGKANLNFKTLMNNATRLRWSDG